MTTSWQDGWWQAAERCPSPNFSPRPAGEAVSLVVLHNISLPPFEYGSGAVADLFANRIRPEADPFFPQLTALRVSSHFVIERNGRVLQLVSCADAAHHAGVSAFRGRSGCNGCRRCRGCTPSRPRGSSTTTCAVACARRTTRTTRCGSAGCRRTPRPRGAPPSSPRCSPRRW